MPSGKRSRKPRKPHRIRWKESALPAYEVEPTEIRGEVKVTCPRRDCGGWFKVRKVPWLRASTYMTRSCPHCFRANQIPKQLIERYLRWEN